MITQDEKINYYSLDNILSRHYHFNLVNGDRHDGKSTAVQRYIMKRVIKSKTRERFAFIVRYKNDIKGSTPKTWFSNTLEQWYKDYEIEYKGSGQYGTYYLYKKTDKKKENGKLIGYCFALSEATDMKSSSYPDINTMAMEEYLNLENKYIKSAENPELEVEQLLSLYSTIARGAGKRVRDNVRCFLISNNYYLNNPYFRYWGMIDKIAKKPLERFFENKEKDVIIEVTHNDVRMRQGRDDTHRGSKFIDLQNEIKIIKNPKVKRVFFMLSFDSKVFYNVAIYNDSSIIFRNKNKKLDTSIAIYSCSNIQKKYIMNIEALKHGEYSETYRILKNLYDRNELYYGSIDDYVAFTNIIYY